MKKFKLRSGNKPSFKNVGASPVKHTADPHTAHTRVSDPDNISKINRSIRNSESNIKNWTKRGHESGDTKGAISKEQKSIDSLNKTLAGIKEKSSPAKKHDGTTSSTTHYADGSAKSKREVAFSKRHESEKLDKLPKGGKAGMVTLDKLPKGGKMETLDKLPRGGKMEPMPAKIVDPDAPGTPGKPGFEPPVRRSELGSKGKATWDKLRDKNVPMQLERRKRKGDANRGDGDYQKRKEQLLNQGFTQEDADHMIKNKAVTGRVNKKAKAEHPKYEKKKNKKSRNWKPAYEGGDYSKRDLRKMSRKERKKIEKGQE